MDDHQDLISKIKREPQVEPVEPNTDNSYHGASQKVHDLIQDFSDLGVLYKIITFFDQMKNETNTVEFNIEDAVYSYLVSVKRLIKTPNFSNSPKSGYTESNTDEFIKQEDEKEMLLSKSDGHSKDVICLSAMDLDLEDEDKIIIEKVEDFNQSEVEEYHQLFFDCEEDVSTEEIQEQDKKIIKRNNRRKQNLEGLKSKLSCHVAVKHKEDKLTDEEEESLGEHQEIIISDVSCENDICNEQADNTVSFHEKNKERPKKLRRGRAIHNFLELLNNSSEMINPLSNSSSQEKDISGDNGKTAESAEIHNCSFCSFSCSNRTELYRHIGLNHAHNPNEHYNKGKLRTDCVFCPFIGATRKSLLLHLRTKHRGGKGYACEQCDYKTHHKSNFDRHVEVVHNKKRDIKCPECGFLTTRNYLLEKHIVYKHRGIKPYRCPEPGCNFGSTSSSNRKAHIMEIHQGLRPNICPVNGCDFGTSRRFVLKNHLFKEHNIGKPRSSSTSNILPERDRNISYPCPHCPYKATQKGNLHKHIRVRHLGQTKRYKCAECDFTASFKCFVKTHISEVHLGQFPYACNLCNFKTSVRQRFDRHFNAVHLKQKPFSCQMCDYKGSQSIHLQRHIEVIHKGEKPHYCAYCTFNTAHRANLRAHLKAIHKISDQHMNEVLQSCLDTREKKKRGCKPKRDRESNAPEHEYQPISEPEADKNETISVAPESLNRIKVAGSVPQHSSANIYNINSLEASFVLEKIGEETCVAEISEENKTSQRVLTTQQLILKQVSPNAGVCSKTIEPKIIQKLPFSTSQKVITQPAVPMMPNQNS